jgi:hypothetical protein
LDLGEPDPRVLRFDALDAAFPPKLAAALAIPADYAAARAWREQTSWSRVAESTAAGYRDVLRRAH